MTPEQVRRINEAIRTWPPDDIAWFRELLEKYPEEALVVARLALLLDARPLPEEPL